MGGDGALYISDWSNALIGHMQHNIRDPNRDHQHGRIYRVTYEGRPLVKRVKLKGKPIETVLKAFFAKENSTRYRAKLELSGRKTKDVTTAITNWIRKLKISNPDEAQALLECLWVFEEHRVVNFELLKTVFQAKEPRVRSAAIRTLGHWGTKVKDWQPTLMAAARDQSALVRAEAVKAAVSFEGLTAAEIIFEVENRPTDSELDYVLKYAKSKLNITNIVQDIIKLGKPLSPATEAFVLRNASVDDLLKLKRTEAVYQTILNRRNVPVKFLRLSLDGLATLRKSNKLRLLLDLIKQQDSSPTGDLNSLGQLLLEQPTAELQNAIIRITELATKGKTAEGRQLGYAAWIVAETSGDNAFLSATQNKKHLRDFLDAVPSVSDVKLRGTLYEKVRPLISELPVNMKAEVSRSDIQRQGIQVDYFYPSAKDVAIETLAKMKPKASGIVPEIIMNVPQRKEKDRFALRFMGEIQITKSGKYTFYTTSDDGSRLYIGKKQVVNNDGLHGMREKSGSIKLSTGLHPIVVTYFDNGGGDGFKVRWKGPQMKKQKISANRLRINSGKNETLHDIAIRSLASIPGHESEKFSDLAALVKSGKNRASCIQVLRRIPQQHWPQKEVRPLVDNLVGYLSSIPARYRTGKPALEAMELAKSLSTKLSVDQTKSIQNRLQNLNIQVIAIGTVPHRMIYDKEQIAVQAGKTVEFRFSNSDNMPHNFAIIRPGTLEKVGLLAEATARDADAMARHYIPKSDQILVASRLIQPGQTQSISFNVPQTPGIYPYVCTYPGHWRRMYGALYVVKNLGEYQVNPKAYLAAHPLQVKDQLLKYNTRGREWKFEELISAVKPLPKGRSFDVGKELFKVSSCVSCHRLNNEGRVFGPDLTKLDKKKQTTEYILQSLLEPSKDIDKKYQSYAFELDSGIVLTGMIVEETEDEIKMVIDPIAKGKPTVIKKSSIEERVKKSVSIMPKGLLNKLSREEILDLVAYIYARGDKTHMLFKGHQMNHKHKH